MMHKNWLLEIETPDGNFYNENDLMGIAQKKLNFIFSNVKFSGQLLEINMFDPASKRGIIIIKDLLLSNLFLSIGVEILVVEATEIFLEYQSERRLHSWDFLTFARS